MKPSPRGELRIVTLLESYLAGGTLGVERMGRGFAWLDTGTHASLLDAGNFVRTLTLRQGVQSGCPEDRLGGGWIDDETLAVRGDLREDGLRQIPQDNSRREDKGMSG